MKGKTRRLVSILLTIMMLCSCFMLPTGGTAYADPAAGSQKYTLTIYLYESDVEDDYGLSSDTTLPTPEDGTHNKYQLPADEALKMKFDVFKVADNADIDDAYTDYSSLAAGDTGVDGFVETITAKSNGLGDVIAAFETTTAGRYYVRPAKVWDDVNGMNNPAVEIPYSKYEDAVVPFMVDLPRTSDDGASLENDVNVYPKMVVTGSFMFQKTFDGKKPSELAAEGITVDPAVFKLYTQDPDVEEESLTKEVHISNGCLTTAQYDGVIYVNNLPFGKYRLTETAYPSGYAPVSDQVFEITKGGSYSPAYTDDSSGTAVAVPAAEYGTVVKLGTDGVLDNPINTTLTADYRVAKGNISEAVKNGERTNLKYYANVEKAATWDLRVALPKDIAKYKYLGITCSICYQDYQDSDIVVMNNDSTLIKDTDYTLTKGNESLGPTKIGDTINIKFTDAGIAKLQQGNLDVIYNAAVKDDCAGTLISSYGGVEYINSAGAAPIINNGYLENGTYVSTPSPFIWTGSFTGEKADGTKLISTSTGYEVLGGAEFTLYQDSDCQTPVKNEAGSDMKVVSNDSDGSFEFAGLLDGTYYLKETKAPAGFKLLEKPFVIQIGDGISVGSADDSDALNNAYNSGKDFSKSKLDWTDGTANHEFVYAGDDYDTPVIYNGTYGQILNYPGTRLPKTGGAGIALFVLGGAALIGISVLILVSKKKKTQSKL